MNLISYKLVYYYIYARFIEWATYWYVYLILSLPMHMFYNLNLITLEDKRVIWIYKVELILKSDTNNYSTEQISGRQLMALSDELGRIPFNLLQKYYPYLDTLYIQYHPLDEDPITRVFDIGKRMDLRTATKCKFGRIEI